MSNDPMPLTPPEEDIDEEKMRRALGGPLSAQSPATPPPATPAPTPAPVLPKSNSNRETVSVRMLEESRKSYEDVGKAIGWSANRIMAVMADSQAKILEEVFKREGAAGVLKLLVG